MYFPKKELFNGTIGEQPENIRMVYSKVRYLVNLTDIC